MSISFSFIIIWEHRHLKLIEWLSLFIHIMPCATLHCLVHLIEPDYQQNRFPAIHNIITASRSSPNYYSLAGMMLWASVPYVIWQFFYHAFITVRRRDKIAAGRPTSFTYLRKSYSSTWIGKAVLSLPTPFQETAFMFLQYSYAILTMMPCPLWLHSRQASAAFLTILFAWSVYRGATYYIEIFGQRFRNELEALKKDVTRWQPSPDDLHPSSCSSAVNSSSNSPSRILKEFPDPNEKTLSMESQTAESGANTTIVDSIKHSEQASANNAVPKDTTSEASTSTKASGTDVTSDTAKNANDAAMRKRISEILNVWFLLFPK